METIRTVIKWFLLVGGMIFWFFVAVGLATNTEKVYDCALAEISPDYPREVVNECRRINNVKPIST